MWVHMIQILQTRMWTRNFWVSGQALKIKAQEPELWLISPVGLRHLCLFRTLSLWTWAAQELHYMHVFRRRPLACPCYLHFMLSIQLRAFLPWSLQNISPEAKFSTEASHTGGRDAPALGNQLHPILVGVRSPLTCKENHIILRNRDPWHAQYFIFSIFKKGILSLLNLRWLLWRLIS